MTAGVGIADILRTLNEQPETRRREVLEEHVGTALEDLRRGNFGAIEAYLDASQQYQALGAFKRICENPVYRQNIIYGGAFVRAESNPQRMTVRDELLIYEALNLSLLSEEQMGEELIERLDSLADVEVGLLREHPGLAYAVLERAGWACRRGAISSEELVDITANLCVAKAQAAFRQENPDPEWLKHGMMLGLYSLVSLNVSRAERCLVPFAPPECVELSPLVIGVMLDYALREKKS